MFLSTDELSSGFYISSKMRVGDNLTILFIGFDMTASNELAPFCYFAQELKCGYVTFPGIEIWICVAMDYC